MQDNLPGLLEGNDPTSLLEEQQEEQTRAPTTHPLTTAEGPTIWAKQENAVETAAGELTSSKNPEHPGECEGDIKPDRTLSSFAFGLIVMPWLRVLLVVERQSQANKSNSRPSALLLGCSTAAGSQVVSGQ